LWVALNSRSKPAHEIFGRYVAIPPPFRGWLFPDEKSRGTVVQEQQEGEESPEFYAEFELITKEVEASLLSLQEADPMEVEEGEEEFIS
jgi:hypothetical protein